MFATTLRFLTFIIVPKPTVFITPSLYADPYTRPHLRLPPDHGTTSTHLFASPSPARYEGRKCARTRSHSDASSSTSNQNREPSFGPVPARSSTPREPAHNKNNRNTPDKCCPCACHPPAPRFVEIPDEHTTIFGGAGVLLEPPSPSPRSRGLSLFELKLKESGTVRASRENHDRCPPQQAFPIDRSTQHQHAQGGVDGPHVLGVAATHAPDGKKSLAPGGVMRDVGRVSGGKALRRTKGVIVSRRGASQQGQALPHTRSRPRSHSQQKSFELELSPIIEDAYTLRTTLAISTSTSTTNNITDISALVSGSDLGNNGSDEFIDKPPFKFKPQRSVFCDLSNAYPHSSAAPEEGQIIPALTLTIPTPELRNTPMYRPSLHGGNDATQSQSQSQLQLPSEPQALELQDNDDEPRPNVPELGYSRSRPGSPSSNCPGLGIGVGIDRAAELGGGQEGKWGGSRVSSAWKKALSWAFGFKGGADGSQRGRKEGTKDKKGGMYRKGWFGSVLSPDAGAGKAKAEASRSARPRRAIKPQTAWLSKRESTSITRRRQSGTTSMELSEEGGPVDQSNGPPANGTGKWRSACLATGTLLHTP